MRRILLASSLLLGAVVPALSQSRPAAPPTVPRIVSGGLEAFRLHGADSGIRALTPAWSLTDDSLKQQQLVQAFTQLQVFAGKLTGYDVIRVHSISAHVQSDYIVLLFENMPAYFVLTLFQPEGQDWKVVNLNFHSDMRQVFLAAIYEPRATTGP